MSLSEIFTVVGLSLAGATFINTLLYNLFLLPRINRRLKSFEAVIQKNEKLRENKWQIKRSACLKALNIADALLSNYEYPGARKEDIKPGKITTEEVRTCFNELACSCDNTEVIEILKKIMHISQNQMIAVSILQRIIPDQYLKTNIKIHLLITLIRMISHLDCN